MKKFSFQIVGNEDSPLNVENILFPNSKTVEMN